MKFILIIITLGIISCRSNMNRSVVLNDVIAEGNISDDTIFNGEIKFYNIQKHTLVSECNYLHGVLNGKRTEYFPDGKIAVDMMYESGKKNGAIRYFNDNGEIKKEAYYYYDLRVGYSINYVHNKISHYSFYSLDRYKLVDIDYRDSILGKVTDQQEGFFFLSTDSYQEFNTNSKDTMQEYFLYTPNPPEYNFRYSIVQVTKGFNVKSVIENFSQNRCWSSFTVPGTNTDSLKYAIQLLVYDPIEKKDMRMYKIIGN